MKSRFTHAQPLVLAAFLAAGVAACDEKLDSGLACPVLCPGQQVALRDTTLFPVVLDTSIGEFPSFAAERGFYIATMGDTLQSRAVVRFDSLPQFFRATVDAEDSLIYVVDTGAYVRLSIITGDTLGPPTTIEVYDVDLGGAEEADPTAVESAFVPANLLGSRTFPADSLRDSARVPIDPARLLAKIQSDSPSNRLRIGIKVNPSGGGAPSFAMLTTNAGADPLLVFRPSVNPEVAPFTMRPLSYTPEDPFRRGDMADYLIVPVGPPDPPPEVLRVGSLPAKRVYFRFDIPTSITDSSNVVRATFQLTQRPNPAAPEPEDSLVVQYFRVDASDNVTDLYRALHFVQRFRELDSLRLMAADSGLRELEIIGLVRSWRGTSPERTPRALALAAQAEGSTGRLIDFFSSEAPESVRPRLRITYTPQAAGGLP